MRQGAPPHARGACARGSASHPGRGALPRPPRRVGPLGVTGTGGLARGGREECLTVFSGRFLCRCEGKMFTA